MLQLVLVKAACTTGQHRKGAPSRGYQGRPEWQEERVLEVVTERTEPLKKVTWLLRCSQGWGVDGKGSRDMEKQGPSRQAHNRGVLAAGRI
jgi:hypothetical protein